MTAVPHAHPLPPDAERRVRGLLDGTLPAGERQAAMEHVRACNACREVYDGVAEAERAMAGGRGALGLPALERVGERLQGDLLTTPARPVRWIRVAALAATTASVLIAIRVAWMPPDTDGGFTARGGGGAVEGVGMRLFRVGGRGAEELRDGATIQRSDQLAATVSTGPYGSVSVALRAPGSAQAHTEVNEHVPRGVVDEPLEVTLRIEDFRGEDLEVVMSFADPSNANVPSTAERRIRLHVEGGGPRP